MQCLHSIVHKGMDYTSKIQLIKVLGFLELLNNFQMKYPNRNPEGDDFDAIEEEEFFECISEVINKLGNWCLEIFKNLDEMLPQEHHGDFHIIFRFSIKKALELLDTVSYLSA
jgi:hypothetical protein